MPACSLLHFRTLQHVCKYACSEEVPEPVDVGGEGFCVAFDPLDGSSIVDTNFAVGTIFGVWPGDKLKDITGREQVRRTAHSHAECSLQNKQQETKNSTSERHVLAAWPGSTVGTSVMLSGSLANLRVEGQAAQHSAAKQRSCEHSSLKVPPVLAERPGKPWICQVAKRA